MSYNVQLQLQRLQSGRTVTVGGRPGAGPGPARGGHRGADSDPINVNLIDLELRSTTLQLTEP